MFVGTGSAVGPDVVRSLAGYGLGPDKVLVNALLLNIALIIFGWRRYSQLSEEVAERRKAEKLALKMAETDPLTGFMNRRCFGGALKRMMEKSDANGEGLAVMMIDIDNFKQINDFNGHSAGDRILYECAMRINSIIPRNSAVARIGGDEFACAVPYDKARPEFIDTIAAGIVEALNQPTEHNNSSLAVTASLGITRADAGIGLDLARSDALRLLEMADIAMYHAKRQGRNSYFWFEDHMANEMRFRREIEAGIRHGLSQDEFVPSYEQQIDVQTGELTGFEMLARWNSPKFGMVKPDIFIPIAENIGAIGDLSECLLKKALSDAKQWDTRLTLAVNISPLQLRDPWFSQRLLKLLLEANFPPQRLEVEITESCLHENLTMVRTLISSLKNQGISVSLDDFGTGYSSLAQLQSLPFDRIKIDRSFVSKLTRDKDSAAIVEAIAMLGKGLGLPVTVEGIEDEKVLDALRAYGALSGQGYLYGEPRSADETRTWLSENGLLLSGSPAAEMPKPLAGAPANPASMTNPNRPIAGTG